MNRLVGKLSSVGISSSSSIQVCDNRELQIGKALSTSSSRLSHEETVLAVLDRLELALATFYPREEKL